MNATRAHAAPAGIAYGVEGAAGGIPFPIPQERLRGDVESSPRLLGTGARTRPEDLGGFRRRQQSNSPPATTRSPTFPITTPNATPESIGGYYFKTLHLETAPPSKVGEGYLDWQPLDIARYNFDAWRILPGEHRVRRGPAISYDTPDSDAAGFESLDEYYIFFGGLDRYDFKLLGKKEMFVPYNNNRLLPAPEFARSWAGATPIPTICATSCTASGWSRGP